MCWVQTAVHVVAVFLGARVVGKLLAAAWRLCLRDRAFEAESIVERAYVPTHTFLCARARVTRWTYGHILPGKS